MSNSRFGVARPDRVGLRGAPIIAFVVAEIIAFVFWLDVGRSAWFYNDEWDFLSKRKVGDLGDLMRPHNGHWTTIPIVAYRALFALFGLRSYLPYRLLVLVLYLAAAALLLIVMRRAGAQPWIATSAAALFALFGAGWVNILRPFQVTFTGALAFGLLQLILSDHDGRFDRRDGLAMVSGLVALMMSGVGVVMVMVVGIAVLLRRGWRPALVHVAPLAAIYLVWLVAIGHQGGVVQSVTASEVVNFVATGLRAGFRQIGPELLVRCAAARGDPDRRLRARDAPTTPRRPHAARGPVRAVVRRGAAARRGRTAGPNRDRFVVRAPVAVPLVGRRDVIAGPGRRH